MQKINKIPLKLSLPDYRRVASIARENNRRISNWRSAEASVLSGKTGRVRSNNHGQYSRRCRYTKWSYTPLITAWATILNNGLRLAGRIGRHGFCLTAPRGCKFAQDELGLKLQSNKLTLVNYHFNSSEILAENAVKLILVKIDEQVRRQTELAAQKAEHEIYQSIYNREIGSVRVTLNDSRCAGNCVEGSLAWAGQRLGLSREDILAGDYLLSVPASQILRAGADSRAQRAVQIAWLRETTVSI